MRVERSVRISDGYMHVAFTIGGSSLIMNFHEDPEGKVLVYLPAPSLPHHIQKCGW